MWSLARHRHALLLLLVYVCCLCRAYESQYEAPFDGWGGETYQPDVPLLQKAQPPHNEPWIQIVSHRPRAFLYHNFLTPEEAIYIRRLAMPQMRRSTVVGANGSSVLDDYRTSFGTFIKRKSDPVVSAIEKRIADWVKLPEVNQEDMQVLRYGQGQEYRVHMDVLQEGAAGPRVATVLMYLADTEDGGETVFPYSEGWANPEEAASMDDASPCARGKVGAKVKMGDALLFWSVDPDGTVDNTASHAACPVLKGSKWSAPKWIHLRAFRPENYGQPEAPAKDPGLCADDHQLCASWAEVGECTKNRAFMVGTPASPGRCQASCKACTPCKRGDKQCYNSNRHRNGYLVYDPAEVGWTEVPGLGTATN